MTFRRGLMLACFVVLAFAGGTAGEASAHGAGHLAVSSSWVSSATANVLADDHEAAPGNRHAAILRSLASSASHGQTHQHGDGDSHCCACSGGCHASALNELDALGSPDFPSLSEGRAAADILPRRVCSAIENPPKSFA